MMRISKPKKMNRISVGWNIVFNILLGIGVLLIVFPMLLVVIISFSSKESIDRIGYSFVPLAWSVSGYTYAFKLGQQLVDSYIVTIVYSVLGTILGLLVMSAFAYVICQKRFWLHRGLTWLLFFTMLFGGGLLPSYMFNSRIYHLNDTFLILLLPSLINASWVIILRTFIKTTIPDSLLEAARMDGAGHLTVYLKIVLPLSKAGLGTIALFSFVAKWNDWFTGMLYIRNPKLVPLQTLLTKLEKTAAFIVNNAEITSTPEGRKLLETLPGENLRMAITVLVVLPLMFAYPFFQRFFVTGLTMGSIKE